MIDTPTAFSRHVGRRQHSAVRRRSAEHVINPSVAWKTGAVLLVLALAAFAAGMFTQKESPQVVAGEPADVWLSGEQRGQLILGSARAERPSMAVALGPGESSYDVVDAGTTVYVQNRRSGEVVALDSRTGLETGRFAARVPGARQPSLVAAGDAAYLVDPAAQTVRRIDGAPGPAQVLDHEVSDWVGTEDGKLWLLEGDEGTYSSFDGRTVNRVELLSTAVNATLTSSDLDPVVYDTDNARLRWPRRANSFEIPGHDRTGPRPLVQSGDTSQGCVTVLAGTTLSCVGPSGAVRVVAVTGAIESAEDAQLFATPTHAVVVRSGDPVVQVISWADGASSEARRQDPSDRDVTGSMRAGLLVIDDPGSRFAFSLHDGELIHLDKFHASTTVVGPDGNPPRVASGGPVVPTDQSAGPTTAPTRTPEVSTGDGGRAAEGTAATSPPSTRDGAPPRAVTPTGPPSATEPPGEPGSLETEPDTAEPAVAAEGPEPSAPAAPEAATVPPEPTPLAPLATSAPAPAAASPTAPPPGTTVAPTTAVATTLAPSTPTPAAPAPTTAATSPTVAQRPAPDDRSATERKAGDDREPRKRQAAAEEDD